MLPPDGSDLVSGVVITLAVTTYVDSGSGQTETASANILIDGPSATTIDS